jgi:hypothetical protein
MLKTQVQNILNNSRCPLYYKRKNSFWLARKKMEMFDGDRCIASYEKDTNMIYSNYFETKNFKLPLGAQ